MTYDHKTIEKKWQEKWAHDRAHEVTEDPKKKKEKMYVLDMFPYPSAHGLHVGHPEGYTATDIVARYFRMRGRHVLHPMGWDAFGLPAENYAIKTKVHPHELTQKNIATFKRQIQSLGFSYDWSREVDTSSPAYYRWTQWLFLQLYKKGFAYKKKAPVNWCPSCQTVLANEQVVDGACERCHTGVEQKELEQWFFKITNYVERLLADLETLDWPERIKEMQRNWIGKSEGAVIQFPISNFQFSIEVFTTRADTLFGATYLVLAPEHDLISNLKSQITNWGTVAAYQKKAQKKTALQRTALEKEKTGVALEGVFAVNPATKEEIPVWIADYVLVSYGTGAIMAVPAHDERDFAFAKKYNLPIRQVIAPETGIRRKNEERRDGGCGVVFDPATQRYAVSRRDDGRFSFFAGGVEDGENEQEGIMREITEESGLYDFAHVEKICSAFVHFHNRSRAVNRYCFASCFLVILASVAHKKTQWEPHEQFELEWHTAQEILDNLKAYNGERDVEHWIWFLQQAVSRAIELEHDTTSDKKTFAAISFVGEGRLVSSGAFNELESETAKQKITEVVGGKQTTQYKLRDWLVSRQRYWGAPIPVIYCDACGTVPVPEKDLPVELPTDVDFRPTGESPLARSKSFHDVVCPTCGKKARRESDTMDTFVDSSWYFLRYCDPKNEKVFAEKKAVEYWNPVDLYVGGAEHAVMHLLYARFITKALADLGHLSFQEPFLTLKNQGLILGEDGQKMSKSRGNVINPDAVVDEYGADTMRMYEMFMGPFEDAKPWSTDGIRGIRRFLEKVWRLLYEETSDKQQETNTERLLHKTVKKVTEDIESFKFNTAISAMMIFVNEAQKSGWTKDEQETFLKILAPFAPHIAEELWGILGHKESIFEEPWPGFNPNLIYKELIELVVQVNGKVRDRFTAPASISADELKRFALLREKVKAWTEKKKIERVIVVEGKLVNIVVS